MERRTLTRVPKPGIYVFEKIREDREDADWSDRTKEWINNIPTGDGTGGERSALTEIPNTRSRKRKINGSDVMPRKIKGTDAGGRHGDVVCPDVQNRGDQDIEPEAPIRRRTTRATQRQTQQLEVQQRLEKGELQSTFNNVDECLAADHFTSPTRQQESGDGSASTQMLQFRPPLSPSKNTSGSTRSSSPSKKSTRIDAGRLRLYDPKINFMSYGAAKDEGLLTESSKIDSTLNTPEKSRCPPPSSAYRGSGCLADNDLPLVEMMLGDILAQAEIWRSQESPEPHWCDQVIAPILNLTRRLECAIGGLSQLKPAATMMNISTLEIRPPELCPSPGNMVELFKTLSKKIDYAMGLQLSREDSDVLENAIYRSPQSVPSINQTDNFANFTPMFLNIEVKKRIADVDPRVQLGVWVTAEFRKRAVEGYDRNMPVVAIAITGDNWEGWIVHETSWNCPEVEEVVFLGPWPMGSTTNWENVFRILHFLVAIVSWGRSEYYTWFRRSILDRYK